MEDEGSAETMRDGSVGRKSAPVIERLPTVDRSHYAIDKEIARGGMGRIFTARDKRLERTVAVKEVIGEDGEMRARFSREAKLTARLQHPGIVSIYEAGEWETGEPFYAMRMIVGEPLDKVIGRAKTTPERVALVPKLLAVAEAVAYAHGQRIIHRDLKPQNVLVGDYGETVVIDWGLAKSLDDGAETMRGTQVAAAAREPGGSSALTVFGSVMGTPSYMPVEQATGLPLDERADVYAIGAMLYQSLCGQPPYVGPTANKVLDKLVAGPPESLGTVKPDVPADLVAIVERAMARNLVDRYANAGELAEELRRYVSGQLVKTHEYTTGELVRRWLRKNRGPVAVGGIAVIALAALGVASYARVVAEKARADDERDQATAAKAEAVRSEAEMLVDRARQTIASGTPARAAPLLAAAEDLGADAPTLAVLEGQVAAALPAPLWTRKTDGGDALAVGNDGAILPGKKLAPLLARAGAPATASAKLDPSGRILAYATKDRIAVFDLEKGLEMGTATGCLAEDDLALEIDAVTSGGVVVGVCRSTDNSAGEQIAVWKVGAPLVLGRGLMTGPRGAAASNDGRVVAAIETSLGAPRVERDGNEVTLAALPKATSVAVDPAGRLVAAGTATGFVQVWEAGSGKELAVATMGEPVTAVAFSPDGGLVVAASKAGSATAWSTAGMLAPRLVEDRAADAKRRVVALRPLDGEHVRWVTTSPDDLVALDETGARVTTMAAPAGWRFDAGAVMGGSGVMAAVVHRADKAGVLVGTTLIELSDPQPIGATLSDDEKYVLAGGEIFEVASKKLVGAQKPAKAWDCATPRADRAVCFVDPNANANGTSQLVGVYHLPDGSQVAPPKTPDAVPPPITGFALTADDVYVVGCTDAIARVHLEDGTQGAPVKLDETACARDVEVSDTGKLGVLALANRRVVLWDLPSGKEIGTIVVHHGIEGLATSPNGEWLALAGTDGWIGVYHARTRALVATTHVEGEGAGSLGLRMVFRTDRELFATTDRRGWRLPWTSVAPDRSWRDRSPFVREEMDVVLKH